MYNSKALIHHLNLHINEMNNLIRDKTKKNFAKKHQKELKFIQDYKNSLLNKNINLTAKAITNGLRLKKHPEGGFYREFIRTDDKTVIFYLLTEQDISSWHSLKDTQEEFKFILGEPLIVVKIKSDGNWKSEEQVTKDTEVTIEKSDRFGDWFGAYTNGEYALVTCTCTGPFDFKKFKLAEKMILNQFKEINHGHKNIIEKLSPKNSEEKIFFLKWIESFCCCFFKSREGKEEESTLLINPPQNN